MLSADKLFIYIFHLLRKYDVTLFLSMIARLPIVHVTHWTMHHSRFHSARQVAKQTHQT